MTAGWRVVAIMALAAAVYAQDCVCDPALTTPLEQKAASAMRAHQYQLAAQHFTEAFEACPDKRAILLELAEAYVSAGAFDAAIGAAQRYVESDRDSVAGHAILAKAYLMARRWQDALSETESILRDHPDEPAALKIKGNAAYLSGQLSTATDTFIHLLDSHPENEEGAYMLGRIYYQEGHIDLAIGQFERVLKLNPASYKALDNLGLCYDALGDTEKATRHFLAAIRLVEKDQPDYEWPYTNLADLLLKNGDARRAFDAASKAVKRNPLSARSFYIGAKALYELGETDLSLNWLQRAVSLDGTSSESWYFLARVYQKLGKNQEAEEARQKFRELKTKEPAHRR